MANDDLRKSAIKELARRELSRRENLKGGASSPANIKAQSDLKQAQQANNPIGMAGTYAKDIAEPVGVAANTAMFGIPGLISKKVSNKDVFEGKDLTGGQKLMAEGVGMLAPTGALLRVTGVERLIGDVIKYSKPKAQASLAEKVQNGLQEAKHTVINNYGKEYDKIIGNSDIRVNLKSPIKNFIDEGKSITENPEFVQQLAAKNPQAKKVMDLIETVKSDKVPEELSAKEADNLSKAIKSLPGIKTKLQQGSKYGFHTVQWTNEDRMLLGLADDIKGSVIEAHPELSSLNKEYGSFMNAYKRVSPDFKIGTTISKLKNYSQYDPQKRQLLEGILPKDTINKVRDFNRSAKTWEVMKKLGLGAVSVGALKEAHDLM